MGKLNETDIKNRSKKTRESVTGADREKQVETEIQR